MFRGLFEIVVAYRRTREIWLPEQAGLGQDRRAFQRVAAKIACRMSNPLFGLESTGQTIDISLDGLGLRAPVNWAEGNQIRMQLPEASFQTEAVIVYRREERPQFRYGIKFKNTGLLQLIKLRRYLQQNQRSRS